MRLIKFSAPLIIVSFLALLFLIHPAAYASTWNVEPAGNWGDSGNWAGGIPNTSISSAVFPDISGAAGYTFVTIDGSYELASLSFTNTNMPDGYILSCFAPDWLSIYSSITATGNQKPTIACPLILQDNITVSQGNQSVIAISGDISGSGGLNLSANANSRLRFTGTATYSGTTTINSGTFEAGFDNAFSPDSDFVLADSSAAVLQIGGVSPQTIRSLSGGADSSVVLWGGTLTVGDSSDTTYAGTITDGPGSGGSLIKQGSGKLTLTGVSTYSGPTIVNAGTLDVNGDLVASAVTVNSGATLKGSGGLSDVTDNGTVAPGNSIGSLSTGDFTFGNGSTLENEINNAGDSDFLHAIGTLTIDSGSILKIIPAAGNYTPGTTYMLIDAPGGVTGTFSSVIDTSGLLNYQVKYYSTHVDLVITAPATIAAPNTGLGQPANKSWLAEAIAIISVATLAAGLSLRYSSGK